MSLFSVGIGVNEDIDSSDIDTYRSSVKINKIAPTQVYVKLPNIIVNGNNIEIPKIELELTEAYDYVYSMQ